MILTMILAAIFMTAEAPTAPVAAKAVYKSLACDFFTYDNALKLIGRSTGADDGMKETPETRQWGCTFTASDKGDNSPRLYFTLSKGTSDAVVKQEFETMRQSNREQIGFTDWPGIGDEAVVHSDAPNFHFVMVRKNLKTIRIKVNPATGVSLDEVKNVAASLTAKL